MLHSHAVTTVRFEGKPLDEKDAARRTQLLQHLYAAAHAVGAAALAGWIRHGDRRLQRCATCLNNVGPGLEMVGPMGSFADFSAPAKLLLGL